MASAATLTPATIGVAIPSRVSHSTDGVSSAENKQKREKNPRCASLRPKEVFAPCFFFFLFFFSDFLPPPDYPTASSVAKKNACVCRSCLSFSARASPSSMLRCAYCIVSLPRCVERSAVCVTLDTGRGQGEKTAVLFSRQYSIFIPPPVRLTAVLHFLLYFPKWSYFPKHEKKSSHSDCLPVRCVLLTDLL